MSDGTGHLRRLPEATHEFGEAVITGAPLDDDQPRSVVHNLAVAAGIPPDVLRAEVVTRRAAIAAEAPGEEINRLGEARSLGALVLLVAAGNIALPPDPQSDNRSLQKRQTDAAAVALTFYRQVDARTTDASHTQNDTRGEARRVCAQALQEARLPIIRENLRFMIDSIAPQDLSWVDKQVKIPLATRLRGKPSTESPLMDYFADVLSNERAPGSVASSEIPGTVDVEVPAVPADHPSKGVDDTGEIPIPVEAVHRAELSEAEIDRRLAAAPKNRWDVHRQNKTALGRVLRAKDAYMRPSRKIVHLIAPKLDGIKKKTAEVLVLPTLFLVGVQYTDAVLEGNGIHFMPSARQVASVPYRIVKPIAQWGYRVFVAPVGRALWQAVPDANNPETAENPSFDSSNVATTPVTVNAATTYDSLVEGLVTGTTLADSESVKECARNVVEEINGNQTEEQLQAQGQALLPTTFVIKDSTGRDALAIMREPTPSPRDTTLLCLDA